MPQQKLTIVPVKLHIDNENTSTSNLAVVPSNPTCMIKTGNAEVFFYNGIDERIIQSVMRELKN